MWKVYGLVDPRDGAIRYVGVTKAKYLSKRLGGHCREARLQHLSGHHTRKAVWLREVFADGRRPTIVLLQTCFTEDEGYLVERDWIARFRAQLVNESSGGKGLQSPSAELSEKIRRAVRQNWKDDDGTRRAQIAAIGKSNKGRPNPAASLANKGRPLDEEHKAAIRAHHRSPEFRRSMSERKKGTVVSDETRANQSVGIRAHFERKRAEFLALPEEERERILQDKSERARVKKREAQQRRREAKKGSSSPSTSASPGVEGNL